MLNRPLKKIIVLACFIALFTSAIGETKAAQASGITASDNSPTKSNYSGNELTGLVSKDSSIANITNYTGLTYAILGKSLLETNFSFTNSGLININVSDATKNVIGTKTYTQETIGFDTTDYYFIKNLSLSNKFISGMYASSIGSNTLKNTGSMMITANGGNFRNVGYLTDDHNDTFTPPTAFITPAVPLVVASEVNAQSNPIVYAMYSGAQYSNTLTNNGPIQVNAIGGTTFTEAQVTSPYAGARAIAVSLSQSEATAMLVSTTDPTYSGTIVSNSSLLNSNNITIMTHGGTATATATTLADPVTMTGGSDAKATANASASSTGFSTTSGNAANHTIISSGHVNILATAGNATATATSFTNYSYNDSSFGFPMPMRITATATAEANATAQGMFAASDEGTHILTNSGNMTVSSTAATATASATVTNPGADPGTGTHLTHNVGLATASANAKSTGMTTSTLKGTIKNTNTGSMIISATAGRTFGDPFGNAHAEAVGMSAFMDNSGSVTMENIGVISAIAKGGTVTASSTNTAATSTFGLMPSVKAYAFGMNIESMDGTNKLTNRGVVEVSAIAGTLAVNGLTTSEHNEYALAFGMRMDNFSSANFTVSNYGIINAYAKAAQSNYAFAYEAFGIGSYNVDDWATTLREWTNQDAVFAVATYNLDPLNTLNFANSTFIARPGTAAQKFALGKEYKIADMVKAVDVDGSFYTATGVPVVLTGTIAEAITEVPFLTATLTGGTDPNTATIRLNANVNKNSTPGTLSAVQMISSVRAQMSKIAKSILDTNYDILYKELLTAETGSAQIGASAGSEMLQSKWHHFIKTYTNSVNNSEYNYDGSSAGVTAGTTYRVNENFAFGGHLDLNAGNYYGDILNSASDTTSFALGLHAMYNITPEWYLSGQLTGSYYQSDNIYKTGMKDDLFGESLVDGEALYASLNSGYKWSIANGHSLTPEIGLSYLSAHLSSYDINWASASGSPVSGYDMSYDDINYSALYGNINLNWRSEFNLNNDDLLSIHLGSGLRHNFTGEELKSNFTLVGSRFSTKGTEDMTSFLVNAGIEYKHGFFSIALNYDGEYGNTQTSHGGAITFKFDF